MYIKLLPSQEYLREILEYNPSTGELTWKYRRDRPTQWNSKLAGKKAGYIMNGRVVVRMDFINYYAARIIWKMMTGNDPVREIDHKDMDTLNDRWSNLREATISQNKRNGRKYKSNKSGYKGVFKKRSGRFKAAIKVDGVIRSLGTYDTAEEAYEAYCTAAKEAYGEFFNPG